MRLLITSIFFHISYCSFTQADINLLEGNWCIVEILNAPGADEDIPDDELMEMRLDMDGVVFLFTNDRRFAVIEPGVTIDEALEGALIFTFDKANQVLRMEDEYTSEIIIIELVKVTKTALILRTYESSFGFELYFRRC